MAKYHKKPVDATQWLGWDQGPHDLGVTRELSAPGMSDPCLGWIDTLESGHVVTPGDWIITGAIGEKYPIKDAIFRTTYEEVYD